MGPSCPVGEGEPPRLVRSTPFLPEGLAFLAGAEDQNVDFVWFTPALFEQLNFKNGNNTSGLKQLQEVASVGAKNLVTR